MLLKTTLITLVILNSSLASADFCTAIFKQLPEGIQADPVEQMITWEQTSNTARWAKDQSLTPLEVVAVPKNSVAVHASKDTPQHLLNYFVGVFTARFPRHPYNQDLTVPHYTTKANYSIPAKFSASRSMFIRTSNLKGLFSIKMPTNKPHKTAPAQVGKSDLRNSVVISRRRSEMIAKVDEAVGLDSKFEVLTDKLAISDKKTGNGYVIRDLTPLTNGNYFLPAFSVPYAGRKIAEHLGVPFETLWKKYWAASLGESKAKLLLRYGLEMKTPNAQNMLIELDKNLIPTGRMFLRDISDSSLVGPIAEGLGLGEHVKADQESSYTIKKGLFSNWKNSVWQMDEGGVTQQVSKEWGDAHDMAYGTTIIRELARTAPGKPLFKRQLPKNEYELLMWLRSDVGQEALRSYHELLKAEKS